MMSSRGARVRACLFICIALLVLIFGARARAGEDYFLVMFGSQRVPADPDYSHTFATFVRASWQGEKPVPASPIALESVTISWLPTNGIVRTLALFPESGRNWELHETIRWCQKDDMRISIWGPYRIQPELYRRAVNQV